PGKAAAQKPREQTTEENGGRPYDIMSWNGKNWAFSQQVHAGGRCRNTCQRNRNKAARLPFEQQQLNCKHDGSERRCKRRRHASRSAGYKKRLSLSRCQVEELRDQRTESAARHNNGTFRAEGTARANGDGRGNRLEHRQARLNFGATKKNGFNRLWDAVAANLI